MRAAAFALITALLAGAATAQPLPFDLGGPFTLIDQDGEIRTEVDPDGQMQLLFFGYANCQEICSAALPLMGAVSDVLADDGIAVRPVMITVDPDRDTVETMGPALHAIHPDFVGLTGTEEALEAAYAEFGIEVELLFTDPAGGGVYSHGGLMFLLDGDGAVQTILPPVLPEAQVVEIIRGYATPTG